MSTYNELDDETDHKQRPARGPHGTVVPQRPLGLSSRNRCAQGFYSHESNSFSWNEGGGEQELSTQALPCLMHAAPKGVCPG